MFKPRPSYSRKLWTPEEEARCKELVATAKYSYEEIGTMMGRTINSIISHARQYMDINNGYKRRFYYHDLEFFKIPNVVNSYIAGFLAADGCIRQDKEGHWNLRLEISILDEAHLLWMKNTLKHEGPIKPGGSDKKTLYWKIHLDQAYADDLAHNFGITPRKAHRLQPPNLSIFDLRFAYLLGLLDGDGCVHLSNTDHLTVGYVSCSIVACQWFESMMMGFGFPTLRTRTTPHIHKIKDSNAYGIVYGGARAICLVQLAQAFAAKHNLPILARKWNNSRLNDYIASFYARFPDFSFDPIHFLSTPPIIPPESVYSAPLGLR